MAASKTFLVQLNTGDPIEVQAERADQATDNSRVTFYKGEEAVASFINVQAWYEKTTT